MNTTTEMPRRRADEADEQREETDPITIRFPKSLRARALKVSRDEDRTFASLVVYALRRYVSEQERNRDDGPR